MPASDYLEKARTAKTAKRTTKKTTPYLFEEDDEWGRLARKHGVRLPQHATTLTTGGVASWLKKLQITSAAFTNWSGGWSYKRFVAENTPLWNLRGFVGLMLEHITESNPTFKAPHKEKSAKTDRSDPLTT